jgi:UDP-glucose 4-epimerase
LKQITTAIIGANGYIGKNLSYLLSEKNINNFDFDISETTENNWMKYSKLDVTSKEDFNKINSDIDVIFFMAGITGTADGFDSYEKYYNINVLGLINLLDFIKNKEKKPKIIFPSTRLVYGESDKLLSENDKKTPKTTYALTKLVCEETLKIYSNIFSINYDVLRICVPYGNLVDEDYSYGTLGFFISKAEKKEPITLYGDGGLRRTFTDIKDICNIFILAAQKDTLSNSIYNIGGESYSLLNVAKKVALKYNSKIEFVDWPKMAQKIESGHTVFDSKKIDTYLNLIKYKKIQLK